MTKSVFTPAHAILVQTLIEARGEAGMLQADLAQRLGKDQSFVSRIENGQRRVDVIEFIEYAQALGADPAELFNNFNAKLK